MWPYVIEEPLRIGTYGVMMALGFLTALWAINKDLRRRNIDTRYGENTVFIAIIFGVIGAKLAYMFTEADTVEWTDFFTGAGLTWHGGLILAATAVITYYVVKKLPVLVMLDVMAPFLATGYAFGRIGCQLSGDGCYGIPCSGFVDRTSCWLVSMYERGFEICLTNTIPSFCMSYPDGIVPTDELVHPTPVFETTSNFLLAGVLWSMRRHIKHPGVLFGIYLVGAGILRFAVEFIRQSEGRPDRFWGLRDAHLVALACAVGGLVFVIVTLARKVPKEQEYGVLPVSEPKQSPRPKKKKK